MKHLKRVLPYLRPYRRLATSSVALIFLGAFFNLLTPWPLKLLVDYVLPGEPLPFGFDSLLGPFSDSQIFMLGFTVALGFILTVIVHMVGVADEFVNTKLDQRMSLDFRTDLFQHAQKLSMAYHDARRSGHLIFAINSQGDAVSRLIMTIPPVAQSGVTLLGMAWITWTISPQLTLIALAAAPMLAFTTSYYMKHIHKRTTEVRMMEGESLSIVHEAVSMMRVIVAFGREQYEQRRFRSQGEEAVESRVQLTVRQALFTLAVNTITAAGTALVLGIGFYQAMQGQITVGDLLVMLSYFAMIYTPLSTISTTIGALQDTFVSLETAFNVLDTRPEIEDVPDAISVEATKGHVAFENVDFDYEGRHGTLRGISFEAKAGQVIAIVGPTGAGKSTLVSLIPRFYDPRAGRILLDGHDIRQLRLRSLRDQISMVLQEPLLFSGTIMSNILYGRTDATVDDVIASARAAGAHRFIQALPDGYYTRIGERGAKLSGGERQRISIARAFLRDSPLLILDEPTSSIDSKTEGVILDALERLMVGRTTFIIAHRLSTIRKADIILVVEDGRIVERGSEPELLRLNGVYKKLHAFQRGPGETDDFDGLAVGSQRL